MLPIYFVILIADNFYVKSSLLCHTTVPGYEAWRILEFLLLIYYKDYFVYKVYFYHLLRHTL